MKRITTVLLVCMGLLNAFAILPGFDKSEIGVYLLLGSGYGGVGADYMEGKELVSIDDIKLEIDGFLGAGIGVGGYSGFYHGVGYSYTVVSPSLEAGLLIYKKDLVFDVSGFKVMPAVGVYTGLELDFSFYSVEYYGSSFRIDLSPVYPYPYLKVLFKKPDWNSWISIFIWPYPMYLGVSWINL